MSPHAHLCRGCRNVLLPAAGYCDDCTRRENRRRSARPAAAIWKSTRWKRLRLHVLERDDHRCTRCRSTRNLAVHHKTALADGGAPYDPDNLTTLCASCHNSATRRATLDRENRR